MEVFYCDKMDNMNTDITTYLISKGITDPSSLASVSKQLEVKGLSDSSVADTSFKSLFDAETARLTGVNGDNKEVSSKDTAMVGELTDLDEMRRLISSLDKSVLGQVTDSLDEEEVAADLLSDTSDANRVIDQLVTGHLNSIVMTDSDDSEDTDDALKSDVAESLTEPSTETLAQNLETLMEHLNQIGN